MTLRELRDRLNSIPDTETLDEPALFGNVEWADNGGPDIITIENQEEIDEVSLAPIDRYEGTPNGEGFCIWVLHP